jgi:hypothetical protein
MVCHTKAHDLFKVGDKDQAYKIMKQRWDCRGSGKRDWCKYVSRSAPVTSQNPELSDREAPASRDSLVAMLTIVMISILCMTVC